MAFNADEPHILKLSDCFSNSGLLNLDRRRDLRDAAPTLTTLVRDVVKDAELALGQLMRGKQHADTRVEQLAGNRNPSGTLGDKGGGHIAHVETP